jgi:uncharacterized membrane protein
MKEVAAAIQPGTAALFLLIRKATADKVLERLRGEGGTVMRTSLHHTKGSCFTSSPGGRSSGGSGIQLIKTGQRAPKC